MNTPSTEAQAGAAEVEGGSLLGACVMWTMSSHILMILTDERTHGFFGKTEDSLDHKMCFLMEGGSSVVTSAPQSCLLPWSLGWEQEHARRC